MVDNDWAIQVASFRFGVIAELVGGTQLSWGEKARILKEKAARSYNIPCSGRSSVSIPTIIGWIKKYKEGGSRIDSLKPRRRRDYGRYRKLVQQAIEKALKAYLVWTGKPVPMVHSLGLLVDRIPNAASIPYSDSLKI